MDLPAEEQESHVLGDKIHPLFNQDPASEAIFDDPLAVQDILDTFDEDSPRILIPDEKIAPVLMVYFRAYLLPLMTTVPREEEDYFVLALRFAYAEVSDSDFVLYMDRCELVNLLVSYLNENPQSLGQPDMDTCIDMLGGEENYTTHILPFAGNEEDRKLINDYFSPKRHKSI